MTLTEPANGSNATSASESIVSQITVDDLAYWGAQLFIPAAFTTGDEMEIRFYVYNTNGDAMDCLYYRKLVGTTSYNETGINIPMTQGKRYKLSIKRTLGTDRTWKWQVFRQSG